MKREKEITQETRLIRLKFWLKRQPLDAKFNAKIEAAEAFKARLAQWVQADCNAIAPTCHFASI